MGKCRHPLAQAEEMLQHKTGSRETFPRRRLVGPIEGDEILLPIGKLDQYFVSGLLDYGKHLPTHGVCGVDHSYFTETCF